MYEMAFPIILVLIVIGFIIAFAYNRDFVIKSVIEIAVDVFFGILFTAIIYLIIPIPNYLILLVVAIIAVVFFVAHIFANSNNPQQPGLR